MFERLLKLPAHQSFFVFGARGTGKSTLLREKFCSQPGNVLYIDLLNTQEESRYFKDPQLLAAEVRALPSEVTHVIIDEVQKIPNLLNVVHALIEETGKVFVLTGSSARKLRHGQSNLLAGRAFIKYLFPLSFLEMGESFNLIQSMAFGCLPKVLALSQEDDKGDFLRAYTHLYLKEEIWAEHFIRKLEPFYQFLEVAAQTNGDVINHTNIARDVGVNDKTVAEYYSILEDTLIGFHLPAFSHSFRKKLSQKPKFYFFDTGVVRALTRTLSVPLHESTYEFGKIFEHFVLLECFKLTHYFYPDYRLSYLRTHDGLEIDLIIERPGQPLLIIEIKSATEVKEDHLKHLRYVQEFFESKAEYVCFARVSRAMDYNGILIYPWQEGIKKYLT